MASSSRIRYASGARSKAHCDRCGQKYGYLELRPEWNGLRVCPECWEPKHPQLTPRTHTDAEALRHPRPDNDDDGTVTTHLHENFPHTAGGRQIYVVPSGSLTISTTAPSVT